MRASETVSFPTTAAHPAELASAVVRRLEERPSSASSWGLLKTIVLGVPSFGLLPLVVWPGRFDDHVTGEAYTLHELTEWARQRGRLPAAVGPLRAAAEDTQYAEILGLVCGMLALLVVGVFFVQFMKVPFSVETLLYYTYWNRFIPRGVHLWRAEELHRIWNIALCAGYFFHWVQVRGHVADVRRYVARLNPVLAAEGLPPVMVKRGVSVLFKPMWLIAAIILAMYGAWWGIPMAMAGVAQRRYVLYTGRQLRCDLAKRVKDVAAWSTTPTVAQALGNVGAPAARRCANPRCLAVLRTHSRFCTRCGTRVPVIPV